MSETVECQTHGHQPATLMCRHLVGGNREGFHYGYSSDAPDELYPDAWCDRCEKTRVLAGGWSERAFEEAGWMILCARCYDHAREKNWPLASEHSTRELVENAHAYVYRANGESRERFPMDGYERWEWDEDTGQIFFTGDGLQTLVADYQVAGSYAASNQTWMWSWANKSFPDRVTERVRRVRLCGEQRRLLKLACALWTAVPEDGPDMQAVAAMQLAAAGTFGFENEGVSTFLTLHRFRLSP